MPVARHFLFPAFVVLVAACQLDWAERPDPGVDAGPQPADAATDVQQDRDANAPDVATTDGGTDCFTLVNDVESKRTKARACTLASGQCQSTVQDQCGCDVVVAQSGSAATATFQQAVATLKAHPECLGGCTGSCPGVTNKNCLSNPDGTYCYQQ